MKKTKIKKMAAAIALLLSVTGVSAQQKDTLGVHLPDADELHILPTEDKVPADVSSGYMRIVLDRKVEAGRWTLIVFPTVLDGYYFGSDAERYKVTACDMTTSPVTLQREKMADLDDFAANQMYLVKSRSDLSQLVAMSPGVRTKVPKASGITLLCLTLDDFKDATGISNITADSDNGKVYDISGRLAKSVRHGIYIVNGKKIFER